MNLEPPISLIERALTYQKTGCIEKAGLIYRGLLRRSYQSARFYTNYGVLQYQSGDKNLGLQFFERALLCDPTYQIAWDNLQVDADLMKSQATLLKISANILGLYPDSLQARIAHVKGLIANSSYELAKASASIGLERNPDDLMLRELSTRCDLALGDIDSALVHLLYILSLKPADAFASIGMSDIALKSGDFESATSILEAAYQANSENYILMVELARMYQSSGLLSKSIEMYALALAKSENSPIIASHLAYCYGEMGEITKAFDLYDSVIQQGVESPESLIPLIFMCSTLGDAYLGRLREYSSLFWSIHSHNPAECVSKGARDTSIVVKNSIPFSPGQVAKVRLGILTGDLGTHVVSSFLASFLLNYSKESLDVEIISNQWKNDQIADVLSQTVSKCLSIADYSESSARNLLHSRNYDVIIETSGFTSGSAIHLLADRCAPIQCHWIGYHASTYMHTMD
jgi:protein O-GlcNAc transferase